METYDLAVIGAGSGGDGVARPAAARGLRVALIERDKLGGECLNYGCDPTKTLYRCAEVASLARRGSEFGVRTGPVEVDFAQVMAHAQSVIDEIRGGSRTRATSCSIPCGGSWTVATTAALRRAAMSCWPQEVTMSACSEDSRSGMR